MRLVKAGTWARDTFEAGSRPQRDTVVAWIQEGSVPGRIIGGYPYVDIEGFAYEFGSIFSQTRNARRDLGKQDRAALRQHYPLSR